ncbi:polypeptide N-acetylgalactosaminyltransferase 3-like [Clytia hemisphaerica]
METQLDENRREDVEAEYLLDDKEGEKEVEEEEEGIDEKCPFGFDFLKRESEDKSAYSPPRLLLPANRHQNFSGAVFNRDLICLDTLDAKDGQWVGFYECHGQGRNQMITFSQDGLIVTDNGHLCLAIKNLVSEEVILKKCDHLDETQIWSVQSRRGWLMPIVKAHYCLTAPDREFDPVKISICKLDSEQQRWQHSIQEVLSLWITGSFHQHFFSNRKQKKNRAKVNKVLLHQTPQQSLDGNILFG